MDKIELIKYSLRGRCLLEYNWTLNLWQRWLYTIKIIICIVLGWQYKGKEWGWLNQYIIVGMHSFQRSYSYEYGTDDASFINITVGYSWGNWHYYEMSDGWL